MRRDVEIGILARRPAGSPATTAEWEGRASPRPTARVAFAAIEPGERSGARRRPWAERPGLRDPTHPGVPADGAEWAWDQLALHLPGAAESPGIDHAGEHPSDAGKAPFVPGTPQAAARQESPDAGGPRATAGGGRASRSAGRRWIGPMPPAGRRWTT